MIDEIQRAPQLLLAIKARLDRDNTPSSMGTEIERQASRLPEALSFWHYRDRDREVDVIVERPSGEIIGIEVKASATIRASDFRGLAHLRERVGDRLVAGAVLYPGERTLPYGEGLSALPLSALWQPGD